LNPQPFARWPGVPTSWIDDKNTERRNLEGKYKMEKEFNGH
jgi:hypothetical protein